MELVEKIVSDFVLLAQQDPAALLAIAILMLVLANMMNNLSKLPGAVKGVIKRRKGQAEIDPTSKLLNDLAESIALLTKNQNQNADNTKRLIDRADLLEGIATGNTSAMKELTAVMTQVSSVLTAAMGEMRGARGEIIAAVNDRIDQNTSGLSSALAGVNATASGNATRLTVLDQKVSDHNAMTAEQFKELFSKLDGLPDQIADVIKPVLAQMQAMHEREIQALQEQYDGLAGQLAAANRQIIDLTAQLTLAKSPTPKPASDARAENPPNVDEVKA